MSAFICTCCQTWPHIPCLGKPCTIHRNLSFTGFIDVRPETPLICPTLRPVSTIPMSAIKSSPIHNPRTSSSITNSPFIRRRRENYRAATWCPPLFAPAVRPGRIFPVLVSRTLSMGTCHSRNSSMRDRRSRKLGGSSICPTCTR